MWTGRGPGLPLELCGLPSGQMATGSWEAVEGGVGLGLVQRGAPRRRGGRRRKWSPQHGHRRVEGHGGKRGGFWKETWGGGARALRGTRLKGEGLLGARGARGRAVGGAETGRWQTGMRVPASGASGPPLHLCHPPRQAAGTERPAPARCNPVTAAQLAGPLTAQLVSPDTDPPSASSW